MKSMLMRCGPGISLWFDHVSELQFYIWINRFHIFVQAVEEGDARRDGHSFNILIGNIVNVFDEGSEGVGVRYDETFVSGLEGWDNVGVKEGEDAVGGILERFGAGSLKLSFRQRFVSMYQS